MLSDDATYVSKDGCRALISVFVPTPKIPQFTMP
jgi:hypothetical protein